MSDTDEDEQVGPQPAGDDNADLHPLFWDKWPENEDHPDSKILQSFIDEFTPEERAKACKDQGNELLQQGVKMKRKHLVREAVQRYGNGLALSCSDAALNATLLCNRAQAHIHLGNWKNALQDCQDAIQLDAKNIKAYYRGARAACELQRYKDALQLCQQGLAVDAAAPELVSLQERAAKLQQQRDEREAAQRAAEEARIAPMRAVAAAITSRGYQLTRPQMHVGDRTPTLDSDGRLHFPVIFVYPETMQQDVVEDFCEDDTFAAHLDLMFGTDAPPLSWDTAREYRRDTVELYFLSHAGVPLSQEQLVMAQQGKWPDDYKDSGPQRYGDRASRWIRVRDCATLAEVLKRPDCIAPGVPVFFVVASATEYRERFLKEQLS